MQEQDAQVYKGEAGSSPTPRDLLAPIFRWRRLVVVSFSGILLGAVLSGILLPKEYDAQMKILVRRERIDPVVTPDRDSQPQFRNEVREEELNSEVELLKSRDLLEEVVTTCGLHESSNESIWARILSVFEPRQMLSEGEKDIRVPQAARRLEKALQAKPIKKTNLIKVSYKSTDPQLAARVLRTLASLYMDKHLTVHRPPGAFDFFQQQTERYREQLVAAEKRLAEFSRGEGVVAAKLEKEITLQKLAEFESTLKETHTAAAEAGKRVQDLEVQLAKTPLRLTTQVRIADNAALLQSLKSTLLSLELKRTELLTKFSPTYQAVLEVDTQIAQTRAAIEAALDAPVRDETTDRDPTHEWLRGELVKYRTELAALQARAQSTARVVRVYQEKASVLDQKETIQQDLMREVKSAEENYLLYLHKQEEARISDAMDRQRIVNVAIAEAATVPSLPSNSPWMLTVLIGGLLASLVSVGLAFVSDYLDPSLRTPDEVQALLNMPVLAAVPKNGR